MLRSVKPLILGAALCGAISALLSTPALAKTYARCDVNGEHCVRITCDRDGDRCWRESKYAHTRYYRHKGHWVCDRDGDDCHYVYNGRKWDPRRWED